MASDKLDKLLSEANELQTKFNALKEQVASMHERLSAIGASGEPTPEKKPKEEMEEPHSTPEKKPKEEMEEDEFKDLNKSLMGLNHKHFGEEEEKEESEEKDG